MNSNTFSYRRTTGLHKHLHIEFCNDIEFVSRAAFETVSGETAFHFCLIVIKTFQVLLFGLYSDWKIKDWVRSITNDHSKNGLTVKHCVKSIKDSCATIHFKERK